MTTATVRDIYTRCLYFAFLPLQVQTLASGLDVQLGFIPLFKIIHDSLQTSLSISSHVRSVWNPRKTSAFNATNTKYFLATYNSGSQQNEKEIENGVGPRDCGIKGIACQWGWESGRKERSGIRK